MPFDGVIGSENTVVDLCNKRQAVIDLKAARRLIASRWRWTRGVYRRKHTFFGFTYYKRCAVGAMREVYACSAAYAYLRQVTPRPSLTTEAIENFNDMATHDEVMRVFAYAIVAAKSALYEAVLEYQQKKARSSPPSLPYPSRVAMSGSLGRSEDQLVTLT